MNSLALQAQSYLIHQIKPSFAMLPNSDEPLKCKHLFPAIISNVAKEAIDRLIEKCDDSLRAHLSNTGLTVHHLAAIAKREDLLPSLCPNGTLKLPKDFNGYTPLHFMAILGEKNEYEEDPYLKAFLKKCKPTKDNPKPGSRTKLGSSPRDLHNLIFAKENEQHSPSFLDTAFQFFSKTGVMHSISEFVDVAEECFGNFSYVEHNVASRKTLIDMWKSVSSAGGNSFSKDQIKAYEELLKTQPRVKIVPQGAAGCGLVAQESIKAGSLIAFYRGEMTLQYPTSKGARGPSQYNNQNSEYFFTVENSDTPKYRLGIEPRFFRSPASMANDGPPNAVMAFFSNKDGLPKSPFLKALTDIQPGDPITWCYGPSSTTKYLDYELSGEQYQKVVENLNNFPLENYFKLVLTKYASLSSPQSAKDEIHEANVNYILSTPIVLYRLIADGHVSKKTVQSLLARDNHIFFSNFPMLVTTLQSAFLLATFREKCVEYGNMEFFKTIMDIIVEHRSHFQKAHLDNDLLGRNFHALVVIGSLDKLIKAKWSYNKEDMERLKDEFYNNFVLSNVAKAECEPQKTRDRLSYEIQTWLQKQSDKLQEHYKIY